MPTERIAMRRVREILRLRLGAGLSLHETARRTGVARSTLREMMARFERSGLAWPLPLDLADAELENRLYGEAAGRQGWRRVAEPDWAALHQQLKGNKHLTLQVLWDEYIAAVPDGYRYSRFCELYASWEHRLPVTIRQTHIGGEKLFIDYAGDTVPVLVDRFTGRTQPAHIFVAVMGASSLTFAHATWTETLPDWIEGHVRAFAFFGGAPQLLVPDNPKVAVIRACFYDPQVNRTYAEMAAHYDAGLLPTRPRRPRDKPKVEAAVRIIERWLLGKLRHRRFYSLAEVNAAMSRWVIRSFQSLIIRSTGRCRSGMKRSPSAIHGDDPHVTGRRSLRLASGILRLAVSLAVMLSAIKSMMALKSMFKPRSFALQGLRVPVISCPRRLGMLLFTHCSRRLQPVTNFSIISRRRLNVRMSRRRWGYSA